MKKLMILSVLFCSLTLVSFKSNAQYWGDVVSGNTAAQPTRSFASMVNGGSKSLQTKEGASATTTNYLRIYQWITAANTPYITSDGTSRTYYFAFVTAGVAEYYSYTLKTTDVNYTGTSIYSRTTDSDSVNLTAATPIDGGVSLLLAGGVLAHLKRKKVFSKVENA